MDINGDKWIIMDINGYKRIHLTCNSHGMQKGEVGLPVHSMEHQVPSFIWLMCVPHRATTGSKTLEIIGVRIRAIRAESLFPALAIPQLLLLSLPIQPEAESATIRMPSRVDMQQSQ